MKLKNSYILLIVMAIFLLVSMGSVCASDMSSADDAVLADDGSNDVLADETSLKDTEIVSNDVTVRDTEAKIINATVKDNESNAITGITAKNLTVKEGNKNLTFNYNNSKITITDKLDTGNHSLIISYLGNNVYNKSSTHIILGVFGNYTIKSADTIDVNSTKKVEIPLNITNGLDNKTVIGTFTGRISYKEGNNTSVINISGLKYENGKLIFDYPLSEDIGSSTLNLVYTENEERISKNITLNRIWNVKIEVINNESEYKSGDFIFKLIDKDSSASLSNKTINLNYNIKTQSITFSQTISSKTDENGIVTFHNSNMTIPPMDIGQGEIKTALEVGKHNITLSSTGMKFEKATQEISIKKATINIAVGEFSEYYGTDKKVTITVTNAKTGEPVTYEVIHLYMPQTTSKDYYFTTNENGISEIGVNQLTAETYSFSVSNNDTTNIEKKTVDGKFTILLKPISLSVTSSLTISYNTEYTATIKVTDKATGKAVSGAILYIKLYTGSKHLDLLVQADKNGIAKFQAPLSVGKHKMVISTDKKYEPRYTAKSVTKTLTVKKASGKISAPKVTTYYKGEKYLNIKLVNTKNNKPIYLAKVNIRVYISSTRYYNYNIQTGYDGKIKLLIDLVPKTYKVEVRSGESKNFAAKKVTTKIVVKKAPAKLTPAKLTAKKGVSKNFKVTVKNTKTKKVIKGVKVKIKVYTGKKYKTFTKKTNKKGVANFNVKTLLKLKVGTHKVVVTSANKYVVAKKAKSTIKITKK